jgi:hypothetical protein
MSAFAAPELRWNRNAVEVRVKKTALLRRTPALLPTSARAHVRLVTRLLIAQAGAAAAVSLLFGRRNTTVVVSTVLLVVALCLLAALAYTGAHSARTVVLGFEIVLIVFGLYRFFFHRYLGGTVFAIVTAAVLLHPSVVRAYGAKPWRLGEPPDPALGDGHTGRHVPSTSPIPDPAGGALGEPTGR